MKVSDCYPIFYAENLEAEVKHFTEDLGFSVKHNPRLEMLDYVVLENEHHRRVDIVRSFFRRTPSKTGTWGCGSISMILMKASLTLNHAGIPYSARHMRSNLPYTFC